MKVEEIIKENQPDIYSKLNKNNKCKNKKGRKQQEHLSFSYLENLMKHDSYRRGSSGAIKQVGHGW